MALTDENIETSEVDLHDPDSVAQSIAGAEPEITPPEDPIVELPRGIWHEGAWQTKCELHELTGEDEERFTRFQDDELFVNVLTSGTSRIGSIDLDDKPQSEQEQIVNSLLIGEQMILLVNIVRVTFGNDRELTWTCLKCETSNETMLLMSEDFQPVIPDGLRDPHSFLDSKGNRISFVPASGIHVASINPGMSSGAITSQVLARVITAINDERPFDPTAFVKGMGMKDRRNLMAAIDQAQPTIDMNLSVRCPVCGEEQNTVLTWADLFRI